MVQPTLITLLITLAALCAPLACSVGVGAFTTSERLCAGDSFAARAAHGAFAAAAPAARVAQTILATPRGGDEPLGAAWAATAATTLLASGPPPASTRC